MSTFCCSSKVIAVMHRKVWDVKKRADKKNHIPISVTRSVLLCSVFKHDYSYLRNFVFDFFFSLSCICPTSSSRIYSMLMYPRKHSARGISVSFVVLHDLERNLKKFQTGYAVSCPSPFVTFSDSSHCATKDIYFVHFIQVCFFPCSCNTVCIAWLKWLLNMFWISITSGCFSFVLMLLCFCSDM